MFFKQTCFQIWNMSVICVSYTYVEKSKTNILWHTIRVILTEMILSRVNHRLEVSLLIRIIFLGFPSCAFRQCHYLHNTRKRHVSSLTTTSGNYINQIPRSLCAQEIYYLRTPSGGPFNGTWKGRKRFSSLAFAVWGTHRISEFFTIPIQSLYRPFWLENSTLRP